MTDHPDFLTVAAARYAPDPGDAAGIAANDEIDAFLRDDALGWGINLHDPDTLRAAVWGALAGVHLVHHLHGCLVGNAVAIAAVHGRRQAQAFTALADRARRVTEAGS